MRCTAETSISYRDNLPTIKDRDETRGQRDSDMCVLGASLSTCDESRRYCVTLIPCAVRVNKILCA